MSKPIRMCINCRKRYDQHELYRFQCRDKRIFAYTGVGRSFYICGACMEDPKLAKNLARICKTDPSSALKMVKEIGTYG